MGWLHDLSEWLLGFAESGWAVGILALSSFTESIFNPIPPDALLIAVAIPQPHNAIPLALLVTASSVAGALVGPASAYLGAPERFFVVGLFPIGVYVLAAEATRCNHRGLGAALVVANAAFFGWLAVRVFG